jgi:hypothetical protein
MLTKMEHVRLINEFARETVLWVIKFPAERLNTELIELKKITGILYQTDSDLYLS